MRERRRVLFAITVMCVNLIPNVLIVFPVMDAMSVKGVIQHVINVIHHVIHAIRVMFRARLVNPATVDVTCAMPVTCALVFVMYVIQDVIWDAIHVIYAWDVITVLFVKLRRRRMS